MRKLVIGGWVALGACVAWYGANGSAAAQEAASSRNAFVEVTAPPGLAVRWISGEDFVLVGKDGRPGRGRVTVRARPGWKLTEPKDGVMELAPGKAVVYAVAGLLGEDEGGGDGHTCDNSESVVTNHVSAPVISLTNITAEAGAILVPQTGITTTDISLGATVLVVSNGVHEMITTVNPCTVCGEPKKSVTTNTVDVIPSEFHWQWSIAEKQGFKTAGSGFEMSVGMSRPDWHSVVIRATTTNLPSCCKRSVVAMTNALVMQLESETVMLQPEDRKRLTVGVGEEVKLSLSPEGKVGSAVWEVDGKGSISSTNGVSSTFTAYKREDVTTVRVLVNGKSASLPFVTIEPQTVYFENINDENRALLDPDLFFHSLKGQAPPKRNLYCVMYDGVHYIGPSNVNFHKVKISEDFTRLEYDWGYWAWHPNPKVRQVDHKAWRDQPRDLTVKVIPGKGTLAPAPDDITGVVDLDQPPLTDGYAWWDIPWYFQVGDDAEQKHFCTVREDFRLTGIGTDNGVNMFMLTVTKGNSGWSISYGEEDLQEAVHP